MKKYYAFFKLRLFMGLQYRTAALAGIITQFFWGFMEIMAFHAFYETDAAAFPMSFPATASYIWLQQAFLTAFTSWMAEQEIFDSIINGNIAYELCRPIDLYAMWHSRSLANRISKAALRCLPILLIASFLPYPYGIMAPASLHHFILFLIALLLGLFVTVSFCMFIYMLAFFTISPQGLRTLFVSTVEIFSGSIIPLPFFPENIRALLELLPFAAMQNVALRIYSGSMTAEEMKKAIILQLFWLIVITAFGKVLWYFARKRVIVQGG